MDGKLSREFCLRVQPQDGDRACHERFSNKISIISRFTSWNFISRLAFLFVEADVYTIRQLCRGRSTASALAGAGLLRRRTRYTSKKLAKRKNGWEKIRASSVYTHNCETQCQSNANLKSRTSHGRGWRPSMKQSIKFGKHEKETRSYIRSVFCPYIPIYK